jgi:transposase
MKIPRQAYTLEFKQGAVQRVKSGELVSKVAKELGLIEQTLRNWVKAADQGELKSKVKAVTAEEMEVSRLRAENARLKQELAIIKKAAAYFAKDVL